MSMRRALLLSAVHSAIGIFGGLAVFQVTPGSVAAAIAVTLAYEVAVAIAMYLIFRRAASRG